MGIRDKIRACNGVVKFMFNYDLGELPKNYRKQDIAINNILCDFLKENNISYVSSKKFYKNFSPLIENALTIQSNWSDFNNWINKNFERVNN